MGFSLYATRDMLVRAAVQQCCCNKWRLSGILECSVSIQLGSCNGSAACYARCICSPISISTTYKSPSNLSLDNSSPRLPPPFGSTWTTCSLFTWQSGLSGVDLTTSGCLSSPSDALLLSAFRITYSLFWTGCGGYQLTTNRPCPDRGAVGRPQYEVL